MTKRPEYPAAPVDPVDVVRGWMERSGFPLQGETDTRGLYGRGYWVTKDREGFPRDRALIRYRGNGSRAAVEQALEPVAERLDQLGVSWDWTVPGGQFAALAVWIDARLSEPITEG